MRTCVVVSILVLGACSEPAPESSPADAAGDSTPAVFPDASADLDADAATRPDGADADADADGEADAQDAPADTTSDLPTVELPVDTTRPSDAVEDATPDGLADVPAPDVSVPDAMETTDDGGGCTGVCVAGQTDTQTVPCGNCGAMTQTRACDPLTCQWNPWVDGTCEGEGICVANATETQTVACGKCGTTEQTRSCNEATCQWDPWVDGECLGEGVCAPGEELPGCDVSSAGTPTSCGVQVCTDQCEWGACELAPGAQCLSGSGSNFQCCTAPGGGQGWQFCSSTTCQWFPCEAHSCN